MDAASEKMLLGSAGNDKYHQTDSSPAVCSDSDFIALLRLSGDDFSHSLKCAYIVSFQWVANLGFWQLPGFPAIAALDLDANLAESRCQFNSSTK